MLLPGSVCPDRAGAASSSVNTASAGSLHAMKLAMELISLLSAKNLITWRLQEYRVPRFPYVCSILSPCLDCNVGKEFFFLPLLSPDGKCILHGVLPPGT